MEKVLQWAQGNDVWAMAVIEEVQEQQLQQEHEELQKLLQEFKDIFPTPVGLPPSRFYDHQIPSLPGVAPVNSRPYKYNHNTKMK